MALSWQWHSRNCCSGTLVATMPCLLHNTLWIVWLWMCVSIPCLCVSYGCVCVFVAVCIFSSACMSIFQYLCVCPCVCVSPRVLSKVTQTCNQFIDRSIQQDYKLQSPKSAVECAKGIYVVLFYRLLHSCGCQIIFITCRPLPGVELVKLRLYILFTYYVICHLFNIFQHSMNT